MIDDDREWLEGGAEKSGERSRLVRPEIANSWRRSRLSGVSPDRVTIVPGEVCLDSRIARVAIPVLGSMADIMVGARTSLLLSAPDGTMLWRWSEDNRLSALLDRRSAVVGTRWNEDIVGTNGLGTALETIQPVMINGSEHFSAALHEFTCAGAPIRHPVTRRVAGVLSVTSLVQDASPLMGPTLLKLAREVEEQLYSDSTLHERELLHHFLTERRRGRNAVVAVSEDVVIASPTGPRAAAKNGINLLSVGATAKGGFDALALHWDVMEQRAPEFGHTPDRGKWRLCGPMHLAETKEQAIEDVRFGLDAWCDYTQDVLAAPHFRAAGKTFEERVAWVNETGLGVIGTPDEAVAQIERLEKQSGGFGSYLLIHHEWARPAATLRSYELFANNVKPRFQGSTSRLEQARDYARSRWTELDKRQGDAIAAATERHAKERAAG
jgi:hypothetical protein